MKVSSRHQRMLAPPPARIAALIADFDRVWPTAIAPAPATVLRHTVEGCAVGKYQAIWRERIEPLHDRIQ